MIRFRYFFLTSFMDLKKYILYGIKKKKSAKARNAYSLVLSILIGLVHLEELLVVKTAQFSSTAIDPSLKLLTEQ